MSQGFRHADYARYADADIDHFAAYCCCLLCDAVAAYYAMALRHLIRLFRAATPLAITLAAFAVTALRFFEACCHYATRYAMLRYAATLPLFR